MNLSNQVDELFVCSRELEKLFREQVIVRVVEFKESAAEKFANEMRSAHRTGQPVIPVVIDSYGGEVYSLLDMITQVQQSRVPVATVVEGKAMSCGAMLFAMGTHGYRFISKDATLMLHDISSQMWGKSHEIKADARQIARLSDKVFALVERNCRLPRGHLRKVIHDRSHAEWYLTANQAKKNKLADIVGVPSLHSALRVEHEFRFPGGAVER